jgi:hypothetical protein
VNPPTRPMSEEGLAKLQASANSVGGSEPRLAWKRLVLDTSSIHCLINGQKGHSVHCFALPLIYVKQERSTRPATLLKHIRKLRGEGGCYEPEYKMIGTRSRSLAVVSALQEWDNRRCSGSKTGSEPF